MVGYADYIIASFDEVLREMEREVLEVEAPLGGELFKKWLVQEGHSERTATIYLSNIKRLDNDLFSIVMDEDFFRLLRDDLDTEPKKAHDLMENMLHAIDKELENEDPFIPRKMLTNCRCAYVNYMKFIDVIINAIVNNAQVADND